MIASVDHTGLTVSDLERSLAFYRDALVLVVAGGMHGTGADLAEALRTAGRADHGARDTAR